MRIRQKTVYIFVLTLIYKTKLLQTSGPKRIVENCISRAHENPKKCTKCIQAYLKDGECYKPEIEIKDCQIYKDQNSCQECEFGFYLTKNSKYCKPCPIDNCAVCSLNSKTGTSKATFDRSRGGRRSQSGGIWRELPSPSKRVKKVSKSPFNDNFFCEACYDSLFFDEKHKECRQDPVLYNSILPIDCYVFHKSKEECLKCRYQNIIVKDKSEYHCDYIDKPEEFCKLRNTARCIECKSYSFMNEQFQCRMQNEYLLVYQIVLIALIFLVTGLAIWFFIRRCLIKKKKIQTNTKYIFN